MYLQVFANHFTFAIVALLNLSSINVHAAINSSPPVNLQPVTLDYIYQDEFDVVKGIRLHQNPVVPSPYGYIAMSCRCESSFGPYTKVHLRQVDYSETLITSKCDKELDIRPDSEWYKLPMHKAYALRYYCQLEGKFDVGIQTRTQDFRPDSGAMCSLSDLLTHSYGIKNFEPAIPFEWNSNTYEFVPQPSSQAEREVFCLAENGGRNFAGRFYCNSDKSIHQIPSLNVCPKSISSSSPQIGFNSKLLCHPDYCTFYGESIRNRDQGPSFYTKCCETSCSEPSLQMNDGTKIHPGNSYLFEHMRLAGPDNLVTQHPFGDIVLNIKCSGYYSVKLETYYGEVHLEHGECTQSIKSVRLDKFEITKSFNMANPTIISRQSRIRLTVTVSCQKLNGSNATRKTNSDPPVFTIPFYLYTIEQKSENSNGSLSLLEPPNSPISVLPWADNNCDVKCTLILNNFEPLIRQSTFLLSNETQEIPPIRGRITNLAIGGHAFNHVVYGHRGVFELQCDARWSVEYFLYNPVGRRCVQIVNQNDYHFYNQSDADRIREECFQKKKVDIDGKEEDSGTSTSAIEGWVIAVIVISILLLFLIIYLVLFCIFYCRGRKKQGTYTMATATSQPPSHRDVPTNRDERRTSAFKSIAV